MLRIRWTLRDPGWYSQRAFAVIVFGLNCSALSAHQAASPVQTRQVPALVAAQPTFVASPRPPSRATATPRSGTEGSGRTGTTAFDLTLFVFASGFALFVALIAWSDQIRGMAREAKEMERGFLQKHGLTREQFRSVLKPADPFEKLSGLTDIMKSGKLKTALDVAALGHFEEWLALSDRLRVLHSWKYWLTVALTISLFAAGLASVFVSGRGALAVAILVFFPSLLLVAVLVLIVTIGRAESRFADILRILVDTL